MNTNNKEEINAKRRAKYSLTKYITTNIHFFCCNIKPFLFFSL